MMLLAYRGLFLFSESLFSSFQFCHPGNCVCLFQPVPPSTALAAWGYRGLINETPANSQRKDCRNGEVNCSEPTPDGYHARNVARVAQFQITDKKYADVTIIGITRVQCFWDW